MKSKDLLHSSRFERALRCGLVAVGCTAVCVACSDEKNKKPVTPISLKGTMSVTGKYADLGAQAIWGTNAIVKWVNETHGGVAVGGEKRPLEYSYEDDGSDAATAGAIMSALCSDAAVSFIQGNYSSALNKTAIPVSEGCGKLYVDHAGADDTIFASNPKYAVQVLAPSSAYDKGIFDLLAAATSGASLRVAFLYEDDPFSKAAGAAAKVYALDKGHSVVFDQLYPAGAKADNQALKDQLTALAAVSPAVDVIVGGGHSVDGRAVTQLLPQYGLFPKAVSLLIAPSSNDFYDLVQPCTTGCDYAAHPAEGVASPGQWELGVTYSPAGAHSEGVDWFGPTQEEFVAAFHAVAGADQTPAYQAAEAGAAVLALAFAIERANSTDVLAVRSTMGAMRLKTFFGDFAIDPSGLQVGHKMVEIQWQQGKKTIVWPSDAKTGDVVYPMP